MNTNITSEQIGKKKVIAKVHYRTGGTIPRQGCIPQRWASVTVDVEVSSVEEFIKKFPPVIPSENLLNAIKKAFEEKGGVTYNFGRYGNGMVYFQ
ncbi:MAG: hypothetical protein LBN27_02100 [Prevotellaceae bacterium]|nr:hypothetical protein [Prevotellaceae bacterium]